MQRRERKVHDKGCPLNMLLGRHKLRAWLTWLMREKDLLTMLKVCAINSWLSPFFGDDVAFGSNDYCEEAEFYNDMGINVLDLLLASAITNARQPSLSRAEAKSPSRRLATLSPLPPMRHNHISAARGMTLPDIAQWFAERQSSRGRHHGISMSEEIQVFARPQLVHWLINQSTAEQRKILAEILVNVVEHHEARMQSSCLARFTMKQQRRVGPEQDLNGSGNGVLAVRLEG